MQDSELYIHVGTSKTGTVFLQDNVFPYMDVNYIRKGEHDFMFPMDDSRPNLWSHETLSNGNIFPGENLATREEVARRLKGMFPNASIIVFIRDRDSFIHSAYNTYIGQLGWLKRDEWVEERLKENPDAFNFQRYADTLNELFDRVPTIDYEYFRDNNEEGIKSICEFIGVDMPDYDKGKRNVSMSSSTQERWRKVNYIFRGKPKVWNPLFWFKRLK